MSSDDISLDEDWPLGVARSRKEAKRERKELLAYLAADPAKKAVAERIRACSRQARCRHSSCPICSYQQAIAHRRFMQTGQSTQMVHHDGGMISLDALRMLPNRRPIDLKKQRLIAASMAQIGQLYPIIVKVVKGKGYIISGLHRYEAAKSLGWQRIWCFIKMSAPDDVETRLILISENLHRAELRVLDWAEYVDEWRRLVRKRLKGGQSAPRVVPASPHSGGAQPHEAGIKKTAKALGFSPREIRRARIIAALALSAKETARGLKLDNSKTVLLEVAALPAGVQSDALKAIAERRASQAKTPELLAARLARAEATRLEATIIRDEDRLRKLTEAVGESKKLLDQVRAVRLTGSSKVTVQVRGTASSPEEVPESPATAPSSCPPDSAVCNSDSELLEDLRQRLREMPASGRLVLEDFLPRYDAASPAVREKILVEVGNQQTHI
jgi:ParB-like chromosome segregation protein Spo0J